MLNAGDYQEIELDSSRATTFNSNFGGEMDPVTIKLKFAVSGAVIELPVEARDMFEKTIG